MNAPLPLREAVEEGWNDASCVARSRKGKEGFASAAGGNAHGHA